MICAFHALCIISLVAVYLDLNLNSNVMFKLKSIWLFLPLFSPLGPAQLAPLPSPLSLFAARPSQQLFPSSLLSFFRVRPVCPRPTASLLLFPSPFSPAHAWPTPSPPGPSAHPLLPSLPTALTGGARLSGPSPPPHRTQARVRLVPAPSSPPPPQARTPRRPQPPLLKPPHHPRLSPPSRTAWW
jgi:hypothetical protein